MSFTLTNQYIIVIQMISHASIKYSYCITHIFNKFTNFFCGDISTCFIAFRVYILYFLQLFIIPQILKSWYILLVVIGEYSLRLL